MHDGNELEPLSSQPSRQANATIAAFAYQLWQSVASWCELADDECLYLEGAEDFDVISSKRPPVASQVKYSQHRITLRSSSILEAISNFWELQKRSGDRKVQYRFISRGKPVEEFKSPFGKGVIGLEAWNETSRNQRLIRPIATFLANRRGLPQDLRMFLQREKDDTILEKILKPVTWLWEQPGSEFIENTICNKLILLGEKFSVPAEDAKQVRHQLYEVVTKTASDPKMPPLDRSRLIEIFSEATHVRMPRSEANASRSLTVKLDQFLGSELVNLATSKSISFESASSLATNVPPLPVPLLKRQRLVETFRTVLERDKFVTVHGSTGMGKSTIAKLLLQNRKPIWLNCWNKSSEDLERMFRSILHFISTDCIIVCDDIDLSCSSAREIETVLGSFILEVLQRSAFVVVTASLRPSRKFNESLGINKTDAPAIPSFTIEEIAELIVCLGGLDDGLVKRYAEICFIHTSGHPQLVCAEVSDLHNQQWPSIDNIHESSKAIVDEKSYARKLLKTLSVPTRELLYRLSLLKSLFRRDQAMEMAVLQPSVEYPGEHLDQIIGPWVEPVQNGYFRISPLIADAGDCVMAAEMVQDLQKQAIGAIMKCEPRTANEASLVLRLGLLTRSANDLLGLMSSFNDATHSIQKYLANEMSWFIYVRPEGSILFEENRSVSRLLRNFQYKIAAFGDRQNRRTIFALWHHEVHGDNAEANAAEKLMLATHGLSNFSIKLSAQQTVDYLIDIFDAQRNLPDLTDSLMPSLSEKLTYSMSQQKDIGSVLTILSCSRCKDLSFFDDLIEILQNIDQTLRTNLVNALRSSDSATRVLIDNPFVAEDKTNEPNWNRCLESFERAYILGKQWGWKSLCIFAVRGSAIILDEKLNRSQDGLLLLTKVSHQDSIESPYLDDAFACIYFNHGQNIEAMAAWKKALAKWPQTEIAEEASKGLACRMVGRVAVRLQQWDEAAKFFEAAAPIKVQKIKPEYSAGIMADAALCWWECGAYSRCLEALVESLRRACMLPHGKDNLLAFRTQKIIGHAIIWIHNEVQGRSVDLMNKLLPGVCSEEYIPEELKSLPEIDIAILWLFLARIATSLECSDSFYEEVKPAVEKLVSWHAPCFRAEYAIQKALRFRKLENLPTLAWSYARVVAADWKKDSTQTPPWPENDGLENDSFRLNDSGTGVGLFVSACISMVAAGVEMEDLFNKWKLNAADRPNSSDFHIWLESVKKILSSDKEESVKVIYESSGNWWELILHALRIARDENSSAKELMHAHCCLIIRMTDLSWLEPCGPALLQLIEAAWRRQTLFIAALNTPRLTIPNIMSACNLPALGIRKAASIVMAAMPAVDVRVSQQTKAKLKSIEEGKFSRMV